MPAESSKEKQKRRMKAWRAANSQHVKDYQRKWRQANKEPVAEYQKAYQAEYRVRTDAQQSYWERNLRRYYGITAEDFNRLWSDQNGKCPVCGVNLLPRGRDSSAACVDHNHDTGEIRGLLCRACNNGIGNLKDSPEVLESAAKYLRTFGHYGRKAKD